MKRRAWDAKPKPAPKADDSLGTLTRTAVWRRQFGLCACCGGELGTAWHCHHRQLRSQGGGDSLSNLVGLLPSHHGSVHNHPQRSYDHGYLVKSHDDPAAVPLHLFDDRRVLLMPDGTYQIVKEVARG